MWKNLISIPDMFFSILAVLRISITYTPYLNIIVDFDIYCNLNRLNSSLIAYSLYLSYFHTNIGWEQNFIAFFKWI